MKSYMLLIACIVIAYHMQAAEAGFNFALPGKWGNAAKRFSFTLPGKWGNAKRSEQLGKCGEVDPEAMYAIYHIIQSEAVRMNDCLSAGEETNKN